MRERKEKKGTFELQKGKKDGTNVEESVRERDEILWNEWC